MVADYDAFSVILRKRMSHGLQGSAHYTWSRTRDMADHSNCGATTMDQYDIWRDYSPASWDVPHRFVASYIYELPFLEEDNEIGILENLACRGLRIHVLDVALVPAHPQADDVDERQHPGPGSAKDLLTGVLEVAPALVGMLAATRAIR